MTIKNNMVPIDGIDEGRGGRYGAEGCRGGAATTGAEAETGAGAAAMAAPDPDGALVSVATLVLFDAGTAAGTLPELESRSRRRRSAPISAAVWQRISRSFSSAF